MAANKREQMKKENTVKIILACIAILSIYGCINYEQETSLNPDLSGRIEIHIFSNPQPVIETVAKKVNEESKLSINMDDALSKATYKIKFDIKEESLLEDFNRGAIKNKSFKKIEKDGITHFYLAVEFYDIRKLFADKSAVSVIEDKGGFITYTQFFNSSKESKKEGGSDNMAPEFFKGFNFKYTLHMPADIVSANTVNIDKKTAVWEFPLKQIIEDKNFNITATCKGENRFLHWNWMKSGIKK